MEISAETGAFREAAAKIKAAADSGLRKAFSAALKEVGKPFGQYVLVQGASELPRRGGLSYRVASATVGVTASSMRATVTLKTKEGYDLNAMNAGILRHPTWGHRDKWVTQSVRARLFSEPFEEHAPSVRSAMVAAAQKVLSELGD